MMNSCGRGNCEGMLITDFRLLRSLTKEIRAPSGD